MGQARRTIRDIRILTSFILVLTQAAALCACTTQDLYLTGQQWQKQECVKLKDADERRRCEKSSAVSFERYQAEAEATKKPAR